MYILKLNPKNELARYINNVPLIIPLLEKEHRSVTRKLSDIKQELRFVLMFKMCLLYATFIGRGRGDTFIY